MGKVISVEYFWSYNDRQQDKQNNWFVQLVNGEKNITDTHVLDHKSWVQVATELGFVSLHSRWTWQSSR